MAFPIAAIPFILAGGASAALPFQFKGISRELTQAEQERERTGQQRTLGQDLGAIWRGITDPGEEGRSRFTQYFLGPGSQDRVEDFSDVPVAGQPVGTSIPPTATVGPSGDWAGLIEALGGLGGGGGGGYTPVSVNRNLFRLEETPEEAALLDRELADIEARTAAGRTALTAGWATVADTNRRAAEKARAQVLGAGDAAAAGWVNAANTASELAAARAQQAGAFEGRQAINVSPTGGAEDFIMFMQSQAPAAAELARGRQETLAADLDWMSRMAGQQGEAYAADLQRQANVFAFERAREHNRAVQERINAERMALAQMEFQAASTNAQLAQAAARETGRGATEIQGALVTSLLAGDAEGPAVLASVLGIDPAQALRLYNSAKSSPLGISLLRQATTG